MKRNIYLLLIVIISIKMSGQDSNQNWVKTTIYKEPVTQSEQTVEKAHIEINYYDGLGRPIQNIKEGEATNGGDIITHIEYDQFGRQAKEYLPYIRNTASLDYMGELNEQEIINFYQDTEGIPHTVVPYSEKEFENSTLNRVFKHAAPGEDWALGTGHEIKFDYQTNFEEEVRMPKTITNYNETLDIYEIKIDNWSVYYPTGSSPILYYPPGSLYKNINIDENNDANGTQTIEFKDKTGKIVLKRIKTPDDEYDTYYVYDEYDNLTYIIPPKASHNKLVIKQELLDQLCYQYQYDKRNRMVAKKLPGKRWQYFVYDELDRLRAIGPIKSPFSDISGEGWIVTKYDVFDRVVYTLFWAQQDINLYDRIKFITSIENHNLNEKKTNPIKINGIEIPYTNESYPSYSNIHILSINYYDDYQFAGIDIPAEVLAQPVKNNTKGLPTGTWTRILKNSTDTEGITSISIYKDDHLNSPVKNIILYPDGGYTQTESLIDFEGKVLETYTYHKKDTNSFEVVNHEKFEYSPQGRLLSDQLQINEQEFENIATNEYDILGQLVRKKVGNKADMPLQSIDYHYNIRGWLTGVNDENLSGGQLFYFGLQYNDGIHPLYNGNISETRWKTDSDNALRSYQYTYDELNRLTQADYLNISSNINNTYNVYLSYDLNGNITELQRNGGFEDPSIAPQIDNLIYSYDEDSNLLKKVVDLSNDAQGFDNGNSEDNDDYEYDTDGNMISDLNKNITQITYNHMNLPTRILFNDGKSISYRYDAVGVKLQKTVDDGEKETLTDYMGGYQYENGKLLFFPTAEGYAKALYAEDGTEPELYQYIYIYKDHLGNNRLSYTFNNETQTVEILEENHYYPFGLRHNGYNQQKQVEGKFKYYFQEQERQDELGLNWDSFKYRNYDYAIGRFMSIDPLAEKYPYNGVYNFSENKVIAFRELEGLEAWDIKNEWDEHYIEKFRKEIPNIIKNYEEQDKRFTCEDLAISSIIDFASENKLPVTFINESGTYDASSKNYDNVDDYKHDVLKTTAAVDLLNNTTEVKKSELLAGDIILHKNEKGRIHHTQVVTFSNNNITLIKQGNFDWGPIRNSSDPDSWGGRRYIGAKIQTGMYINKNGDYVRNGNKTKGLLFSNITVGRRWDYSFFNIRKKMDDLLNKQTQ